VPQFFSRADDAILVIRSGRPGFASSEYAALFGSDDAELAPIDLRRERALVDTLVDAAQQGLIRSCHDVSDGGLAVAVAEACFNLEGLLGAELTLSSGFDSAIDLFGEGRSTVVVSAPEENAQRLTESFRVAELEIPAVGRVTATSRLRIGSVIDEDLRELQEIYERALPERIGDR
jgi:phosphoribosylformylglycinamidine (FGAM) synthase-like enzyme